MTLKIRNDSFQFLSMLLWCRSSCTSTTCLFSLACVNFIISCIQIHHNMSLHSNNHFTFSSHLQEIGRQFCGFCFKSIIRSAEGPTNQRWGFSKWCKRISIQSVSMQSFHFSHIHLTRKFWLDFSYLDYSSFVVWCPQFLNPKHLPTTHSPFTWTHWRL